MQACFSQTIAEDWLKVGARSVLSFTGFNRNFFYIDSFLKYYRLNLNQPELAHTCANRHIEQDVQSSILAKKLIGYLGMSVAQYLQENPNPILDTVNSAVADPLCQEEPLQ